MELYRNKYQAISYIERFSILRMEYFPETINMSDEEYQTELLNWFGYLERTHVAKAVRNQKKLQFSITPDLQLWVADNIFVKIAQTQLKKVAFVVSEALFTKVSIEQMMDENKDAQSFILKYFDDEDALEWLNN